MISLHWKTASETPGTRFEIQRSKVPENGFETIGWINGKGMTSRISEYYYEDKTAEPGILYYYRVLNTEPDGKSKPSEIRMAKLEIDNKINFAINPTLFQNAFTVQCEKSGNTTRQILVYDLMGKMVLSEELPGGISSKTIDAYSLASGMYIVNIVEDNHVVLTKKIQKEM
jgi:hypothetical protein